jgi:hypothetical protein
LKPQAASKVFSAASPIPDQIDEDAHAATVSDYVDGKICLICDVEFQSPILAIKHAKRNHLNIIDSEDNFDFDLDDEQIDSDNSASSVSSTLASIDLSTVICIPTPIPNFCFVFWKVQWPV